MSKNESRADRKNQNKNLMEKSKASLNKVYYWIIAFLFFVLFLLVIFIFGKSGNKVDLTNNERTDELVQEESDDEDLTEAEKSKEEKQKDIKEEETDNDAEEKEEDSEEEISEEKTVVDEDAPHDSNHTIDFNNGSADRLAIKQEIMKVTGLGNDLIEYWVGNNGPGRVSATVTNLDKSKVYELDLQYGDGDWHVTNYKSLDSVPDNFD